MGKVFGLREKVGNNPMRLGLPTVGHARAEWNGRGKVMREARMSAATVEAAGVTESPADKARSRYATLESSTVASKH